jgi:ribonuclease HI
MCIGVVGVGGAIMNPRETIETFFAWGLGISSNNQAEACALLQGMGIAINSCIQSLILVGDSKAIISQMVLNTTPVNNLLASTLVRTK